MAGNKNSGRRIDKPWRDALNMAIKRAVDGDPKGKTLLYAIAEKTVEMARNGDMQAIKEIADRLDGKPPQALEHSGDININPLSTVLGQVDGQSRDIVTEQDDRLH